MSAGPVGDCCPICGQQGRVIGATQALCITDDCRAIFFDPSQSAAEQLATMRILDGDALFGDGGAARD